jgi:hypothetical protein
MTEAPVIRNQWVKSSRCRGGWNRLRRLPGFEPFAIDAATPRKRDCKSELGGSLTGGGIRRIFRDAVPPRPGRADTGCKARSISKQGGRLSPPTVVTNVVSLAPQRHLRPALKSGELLWDFPRAPRKTRTGAIAARFFSIQCSSSLWRERLWRLSNREQRAKFFAPLVVRGALYFLSTVAAFVLEWRSCIGSPQTKDRLAPIYPAGAFLGSSRPPRISSR